jgi:hypothetical protein
MNKADYSASKTHDCFWVQHWPTLVLAMIAIAGSYWRKPRLLVQAHIQMFVDLIVLTVIINASGGLSSSLNSLLIAAVAANGILLPLVSALLTSCTGLFSANQLLVGGSLASRRSAGPDGTGSRRLGRFLGGTE